eukprot:CAMPEP_0179037272 /NCGR_PEP_ID=MMETSP0796-20121207/14043_1 /TAXON_ID=73915 /ORGANISM="Pyrodinium bahamense, Strain pbaha01" /LENGTH=90 /DNA_ID=CAMNT_0020733575 /DNA_START=41 /DNA_END=310 /DNA_ORIENTATION=-
MSLQGMPKEESGAAEARALYRNRTACPGQALRSCGVVLLQDRRGAADVSWRFRAVGHALECDHLVPGFSQVNPRSLQRVRVACGLTCKKK